MINLPSQKDSGRKLFFGLFVFPLLIAIGMAVLLCTVVLLTREAETPESLIIAIKTGPPSKRWQKAFELSNELNQGRGMIRTSGVMKEVIHILNHREEYDAQTRAYMALALSRFEDPAALAALQDALGKETEPDVQLYLMWALGVRAEKASAKGVVPFLKSENPDLRKTAAYVLGALQEGKSRAFIKPLLEDADRDVRWNAALSLARFEDDAGYAVLVKMTDRQALAAQEALPESKIEEIIINAVKGLALIPRRESLDVLSRLSQEDPSLKVRQAAFDALDQIRK